MANLTDHQIMHVAEVGYNTPVAVSRAVPCLPDSTHEWEPNPYQGKGLYVGAPGGVFRSDRRGAGLGRGKLVEKYEALSKGLGVVLNAAFGTSTHTLVGGSGTTYQQVFTPTVTGTVLPSRTVQYGVVDLGGTARAHTYSGVTVDEVELDIPEGPDALAVWSFTSDACSLATATALGTFTPAASPSIFGSWSTTSTVTLGGTLTVPTTTALASVSGGTSVTSLRSATLNLKNSIDDGRWRIAGRNQPTVRRREITIRWAQEFDATTVRDLQISQGATSLLIQLTTGETLSTGTATLQVAIPRLHIDAGSLPQLGDGETVVSDVSASILWDGTNQPVYVVQRTADTAL